MLYEVDCVFNTVVILAFITNFSDQRLHVKRSCVNSYLQK